VELDACGSLVLSNQVTYTHVGKYSNREVNATVQIIRDSNIWGPEAAKLIAVWQVIYWAPHPLITAWVKSYCKNYHLKNKGEPIIGLAIGYWLYYWHQYWIGNKCWYTHNMSMVVTRVHNISVEGECSYSIVAFLPALCAGKIHKSNAIMHENQAIHSWNCYF